MPKNDERIKAIMVMQVSLDKKFIIIKNEGVAIASKVQILFEHEDYETPPLSVDDTKRAEISYMPQSMIKLPVQALATGYYKATIKWSDDFKENNEAIYHIYTKK